MKKLTINQLMKLSEYIESGEINMLLVLIKLNNEGNIEKFCEMIGKTNLIKDFYKKEQRQKQ